MNPNRRGALRGGKLEKRRHRVRKSALRGLLRLGERLIYWWAKDCAPGCVCTSSSLRKLAGVPCLPLGVGRTVGPNGCGAPVDRCLACGATWSARDYRWQPAVVYLRGQRRKVTAVTVH